MNKIEMIHRAKATSTDRSSPTAEVIMKNENNTWSLGKNKAHKKAAAGGRQGARADPPSSGGHYEKMNKAHKKAAAAGRQGVRTDPTNSGGHYEK